MHVQCPISNQVVGLVFFLFFFASPLSLAELVISFSNSNALPRAVGCCGKGVFSRNPMALPRAGDTGCGLPVPPAADLRQDRSCPAGRLSAGLVGGNHWRQVLALGQSHTCGFHLAGLFVFF